MIKLEDVLLTHKEQNTVYNLLHSQGGSHTNRELANANCKAQCLKLLDVLEKGGHIAHEQYEVHECCDDGLTMKVSMQCTPKCWLCTLEKLLKER